MSIISLIQRAYREQWAVGQFNMSNLETLQAIVSAANEVRSPVLVGVSMGTIRHVGFAYLQGLMQGARAEAAIPLYFHLDHGPDFVTIKRCIEIGFDSVMIDTSKFVLQENIQRVNEVVAYAHARGVGVEAQIGETWDEETGETVEARTDPLAARAFVQATNIDYLAISFGNTPGRLEGEAAVDLGLVAACAANAGVPIVLHGGTSIPDDAMRQAIQAGAAKVNIDTAIRKAITNTLTSYASFPADPRIAFKAAREAAKQTIMAKMALFGSLGKAD